MVTNRELIKFHGLVGEYIKEKRESKNMSQATLANKCGINQSQLSRMEAGERCPSLYLMLKVCIALKICIGKLLKLTTKLG